MHLLLFHLNRELKSLSNGINLSRKLYKHFQIPISDDIIQLKNALRESIPLSTPACPRTLAVLQSNQSWDQIGLSHVKTRRLTFAPSTEFPNITHANLSTINANALLLSLQSCCLLRETLCHSNLYNLMTSKNPIYNFYSKSINYHPQLSCI